MAEASIDRVPPLDAAAAAALQTGRLADPFGLLGPHQGPRGRYVRVYGTARGTA